MFFFGRLHSLQEGNGLIWHARVIIITKIAAMNFDLTLNIHCQTALIKIFVFELILIEIDVKFLY